MKYIGTSKIGKTKYEVSINLTSSLDDSVAQDENSIDKIM